jgi:hypothetical protein
MALVRTRSDSPVEGNYLFDAGLTSLDPENVFDTLNTVSDTVSVVTRHEDNDIDFLLKLLNPIRI